jgi:hypothetical protein
MPQLFTYANKVYNLVNYSPRGGATVNLAVQSGLPDGRFFVGGLPYGTYIFGVGIQIDHEMDPSFEVTIGGDVFVNFFEFKSLLAGVSFYHFHPNMINAQSFSNVIGLKPPFSLLFNDAVNYLSGTVNYTYFLTELQIGSSPVMAGFLKDITFSTATIQELNIPIIKGTMRLLIPYRLE